MYIEMYFAKLNVAFAEMLIINLIIELYLPILLLIERISDIFILIYGNLKALSKMKSRHDSLQR